MAVLKNLCGFNWKVFITSFLFLIFLIEDVSAHCPLCTAGAAAAAGGAVWLGLNKAVVSLFIGAFAVSTGWWASRFIKKKYIPFQKAIIVLISFLITILPILSLISYDYPLYISLLGDYVSILNRTYVVDLSLVGSVLGGLIVVISPAINKKLKSIRGGKGVPYQGILLTFVLLLILSIVIQWRLG